MQDKAASTKGMTTMESMGCNPHALNNRDHLNIKFCWSSMSKGHHKTKSCFLQKQGAACSPFIERNQVGSAQ